MKKLIWSLCCLFAATAILSAQNNGGVKATLVDATTDEPVLGAVVELVNAKSNAAKQWTSGYKGVIDAKPLAAGTYNMTITYLGYKDYTKEVKVGNQTLDLGKIRLEQDVKVIDAIKVEAMVRTSQKGDTVSYNAAAFKVSRDADAEGLLAKMPGITINNDGTVTAKGETVQKVFVDGKEFFGDDVSTTIKTIPAEMVNKIEVYNKLSDRAEFTGLDDGEGYMAINIVTHLDKRSGKFGKLYGSYGIPDKYIAGGNVNLFSGDQKISIIGLANNINQTNFSFEDIVGATTSGASARSGSSGMMGGGFGSARKFMVRPQDGISTVQSIGLNYSNTWNKKLELQGSYFFNHTANENNQTVDRTTYTGTDYTQLYNSEGNSTSNNYNHRMNILLDYKLSDAQSIRLRANYSIQDYEIRGTTNSTTMNGTTNLVSKEQSQKTNNNSVGTYGTVNLLYRAKLGKPGRTLTIDSRYRWNDTDASNNPQYAYTIFATQPSDSTYSQLIDRLSNSRTITASATYTEPLSQKAQLSLEYRLQYRDQDQDKKTQVSYNGADYVLNTLLSNVSKSGYLTQSIGPGFNFSSGATRISAEVKYQRSSLDNSQTLPTSSQVNYSFNNVVYGLMSNINFDSANALRIMAHSDINEPSISQLQDAVSLSGNSWTAGNPDLKPSYSHRLMAFYTNTDVVKGRTFMLMGGIMADTKSIVNNYYYNTSATESMVVPGTGITLGVGDNYSQYINHSGTDKWQLMSNISYGFPVKFLKSNFTINGGVSMSQSPSYINGNLNTMNGTYFNGGVQVGSNISENVDFRVNYNASYNINKNQSQVLSQDNTYFSQLASAEIKWVIWKGITLTANGSYNQYKGITDSYNEEILLANAYIGKKLFRNQRGELSIGVNDIFNQNKDFNRSVGTNYIQNTTNLAIGRYVAVQFVYNLRAFGKGSSSKDFDSLESNSKSSEGVGVQRSSGGNRHGMMGPPPGGGRPR